MAHSFPIGVAAKLGTYVYRKQGAANPVKYNYR
jgi:hypothetical protein